MRERATVHVVEASSAADRLANEEFRTRLVESADKVLYGEDDDLDWDAERYVLLARREPMGPVLGSCTVFHIGGVAKITDLLVDPSARRKGVARALVDELERRARSAKCHRLHAITVAGSGAEAFWRAMGWSIAARLPDHYFRREHVVMTRPLE